MVYCVKCGAKNPDDAKTCSQCGAPLYKLTEGEFRRHERECFGAGSAEPRERIEEECFGVPISSTVMGLVFGIIIIIVGFSFLLRELYGISVPWWPLVIIIFGVLIVAGAIYSLSRKR
ncbi:MAG: zinc ribbon domain-containing protein [Nitrososphaerota archaeon]|nr:zinc ribbon domain-containing protein [Candidatus Bathyarchaeota archaeon]MDW8023038.1 zinc ribbon domain-containing protein [Nitrososphaerota archaeon]